jgi:hypothetical protein
MEQTFIGLIHESWNSDSLNIIMFLIYKKTEHIQVTFNKQKYKNSEYDDNTIECLMKYLELESYEQLQDFLNHSHVPKFD